MKGLLLFLSALCVVPMNLFGWTNGELSIWISGPWAWSNLIKRGIDFGVAPIPGVDENVGRPFIGVSVQVAISGQASPQAALQDAEANVRHE